MSKKTTLNQKWFISEEELAILMSKLNYLQYLGFYTFPKYAYARSPEKLKEGFQSADIRYERWCKENNIQYSYDKQKYKVEEIKALIEQQSLQLNASLWKKNKEFKPKDGTIKSFFESMKKEVENNDFLKLSWEKLPHLNKDIVFYNQPYHQGSREKNSFLINAFYRLIYFEEFSNKDMSKIKVKRKNPFSYFEGVVKEVIGKYNVPSCLMSWWFSPEDKWHKAYVDLARGKSVYKVFNEIETIPLSKKQVYLIMTKYSNSVDYEHARLESILNTLKIKDKIKNVFKNQHDFLRGLNVRTNLKINYIKFLNDNSDFFDLNSAMDLYDYLVHLQAAQPGFSFENTTMYDLMLGMHQWHVQLGRVKFKTTDKRKWSKSYIEDYLYVDVKEDGFVKETVMIKELTSAEELYDDGKSMRHCVYSYASRCEKGECAIFSVRHKLADGEVKKIATIQIALDRRANVQFKGRANSAPNDVARKHVLLWQRQEKIC